MKKNTSTKKNFFLRLLKGLFFIVIVAGITLAIVYFINDNTKKTVDELLGLDPNATTEQKQESDSRSNTIAIPGFEKLVFKANRLTQEVSFKNPEKNEVYFIISLDIEGKSVYESQLIEPGKGIYSIDLPTSYTVGEYAGKLTYETRSMSSSKEKKNGAQMNIPIIFE